jgi:hypothetical protein
MYINNGREECIIGEKGIAHFEAKYNATYVSDLCLKTTPDTWAEEPAAIFYQPNPQPGHSDYFGVLVKGTQTYITSGDSAVSQIISGIVSDEGEIIYSRYRHDFRTSKDKSVYIDGGRDYTKNNNPDKLISLIIVDGEMKVLGELENNQTKKHKI